MQYEKVTYKILLITKHNFIYDRIQVHNATFTDVNLFPCL